MTSLGIELRKGFLFDFLKREVVKKALAVFAKSRGN